MSDQKLTRVILDGVMGEKFGREWELCVNSPLGALKLINVNLSGNQLIRWIRDNLKTYSKYHIVCEYDTGYVEEVSEETLIMERKPAVMRFEPIIEGASGAASKILVGTALVVAGYLTDNVGVAQLGVALMVGGIVQMLAPQPNNNNGTQYGSYYFNGAVNTTGQGAPVQLIYGRCRVGSHLISASISIDQLAANTAPENAL